MTLVLCAMTMSAFHDVNVRTPYDMRKGYMYCMFVIKTFYRSVIVGERLRNTLNELPCYSDIIVSPELQVRTPTIATFVSSFDYAPPQPPTGTETECGGREPFQGQIGSRSVSTG